MKLKFIAQSTSAALAAVLLMAMSSAVMAESVQTVNPFDMTEMQASHLVMSGGHDHDHDSDKKDDDDKSKEKKEGGKAEGKCGADHQKKNEGKCGGH